ncbi:MAG: 6-carboxytetrahydropterin synthase QueD [Deltaproteobacteria bacterium]|jgi:6-pyruvoyltetrahydropterin/6-carboxytetrahydropterin synthase|nr:6-carboxytetrahydropterin synthase QueD [Deltaproteobacteria bacterium]
MYELKIITEFSAAHNLRNFRGKCEALHGHNWKVEVVLSGKDLDDSGVVLDFAEVKAATGEIMSEIDHRYLNDLPFFMENNPSSENIARYIFHRLREKMDNDRIRIRRVTAWESQDACASYLGESAD